MSSSAIAIAGEQVLMRTDMAFHACPEVIEGMLDSLGADRSRVALVTDTGAHYKIKLISSEANLVFLCNGVAEQITVTRTTPGELITAQK
ncbi:MAG: hypothetical protein AAFY99_13005 [Pseudomonadota bacterium]